MEIDIKRECNICYEDEEKGEVQWDTPCSNRHVYCRDCIVKWMKRCKERRKKFDCPICKEELDETMYIERELDRRMEEVVIQSNQQKTISKLLFHIFFGYVVPLGMIMLLVYVINTVKNKVSCVFASFFILFILFLYVKTYNFVPDVQTAPVHPS